MFDERKYDADNKISIFVVSEILKRIKEGTIKECEINISSYDMTIHVGPGKISKYE